MCGRPTVMTDDTLQKLNDAYSIGLSDVKACAYTGITVSTLHNYQNANPKFIEEKEALRLKPDLLAQQTIVTALNDPQHAWRWLEKKDKDFMPTSKVEHGGRVEVADLTEEMSEEEKNAMAILRSARRKRIEDKSKELE